jgi:two-component system, LytTR family, response regulator
VAHLHGFRVSGEAGDADEAVALIERTSPDIVLLDVHLPGASGFDVLRRLNGRHVPVVVFVTAFDDYAIRAFEVNAVDYVLKPFTDARVRDALNSAAARLRANQYLAWGTRLETLLAALSPGAAITDDGTSHDTDANRIVVRSIGRTEIVMIDDLLWVEASGYCVRLHLREGTLLHRESLDALSARLSPEVFVRVHRSAVVRVKAVRRVRRMRSGLHELTLDSGERVAVSRKGWSELRGRLTELERSDRGRRDQGR